MSMRKTAVLVATVAMALLALHCVALADGGPRDHFGRIEGTWRSADTSSGSGGLVYVTRTSFGEFQVMSHYVGPLPAGIVADTPIIGTARRVSLNEFEYTLVMYRQSAGPVIAAVAVLTGTYSVNADDTMDFESYWAVYTPDQDPWSGEPPALGCYGPFTGTYARITPRDSCEP